jgi:hypothetical protein
MDENWKLFGDWDFEEEIQRRGADVNTPEIGSRGRVCCFGGILGFYAELRRELIWGILNLGVFCVLGGKPRGVVEEGDLIVSIGCDLGELKH